MRPLILLAALARVAHAECPEMQASCALQAEGVELLVAGRFAEAEERFRASIAAAPSARAYLGYAQAVEGLGKLGLGHDMLLAARDLSMRELAADPQNVEAVSRAERIAYKLAELAPRVGFVRLYLPVSAQADRIVEVARAGEGVVHGGPTRAFAVTPGQRLLVVLASGARGELVAAVAPGARADLAVPVMLPGVSQVSYEPRDDTTTPPPRLAFGIAALGSLSSGNVGHGVGAGVRIERRLASWVGALASVGWLYHPAQEYPDVGVTFRAQEVAARVGVRTASMYRVYATLELGALYYARTATAPASGGRPSLMEESSRVYPAATVGAGLRAGGFDVGIAIVIAAPGDAPAPSVSALLGVGYAGQR